MLHSLFGSKSVEKILFFLLINGKCYASKLAKHFKAPLTPIQLGLVKLEEMGILESGLEGKIRYYQFNPQCPYLQEFEALLRRAYTLLPGPDKKEYYDPEVSPKGMRRTKEASLLMPNKLVVNIWSKLAAIKKLSFTATSQSLGNSGWNGVGQGEVAAKQQNDNIIIFNEKGAWTSREGKEFRFTNVFRWSLDSFQNLIMLEHLRFGADQPVFLFHLAQVDEETLESVSSHVCKEDTYLGQVRCHDHFVKLNWRIIGPKKNEEIDYIYT